MAAGGCASSAPSAALPGEVEAARAEAESAFGDGTVFVERYVERGRHVEVQVLGTPDGILVLGERDCSLQRRHQKVVEESPAPGLPAGTRQRLHDAGLAAAAAIDYLGAGTVEFLYDEERDELAFLEMNTRLQVEHPVTEMVWGDRPRRAADRGGRGPAGAARRGAVRPRDRGAALRRGPRPRLPAAERPAAHLRHPHPARRPGRRRVRGGQRGVDALRRHAGQGGRPRAVAGAGGAQAGRRPGALPHPRRHHQPRAAQGGAARPRLPRGPRAHGLPDPRAPRAA